MELGLWTVPGRRSGAGPADWRAKGNCWGAFKMVILFGRHADGAVEPEILAVEICVAGQFEHQAAELLGLDQALGEGHRGREPLRSEEHTSELQSLMRHPYAGFCLKKKT